MEWFIQSSEQLLKEEVPDAAIPNEPYFVDFLQDEPEEVESVSASTNEDLEIPKIYEMVKW